MLHGRTVCYCLLWGEDNSDLPVAIAFSNSKVAGPSIVGCARLRAAQDWCRTDGLSCHQLVMILAFVFGVRGNEALYTPTVYNKPSYADGVFSA